MNNFGFSTNPGYIYILLNENNPNEIKIGLSKDPVRRRDELHSTGTPMKMSIRYLWAVEDMHSAEKCAHFFFEEQRISQSREFFNIVTETQATELPVPHQYFNGVELALIYLDSLVEPMEDYWESLGINFRWIEVNEYLRNRAHNEFMMRKYDSF